MLAEDKKVDRELIIIAGWLHDMGKIMELENHAQHSLEVLEKNGFEVSKKLRDCIINHGSNGNPECEEAKLIQFADKISILHPELVKILVKYSFKKTNSEKEKDLDFIRKLLNQCIDVLRLSF